MSRFPRFLGLAAIGFGVFVLSASAQDSPPSGSGRMAHGNALRGLRRCLSGLDLNADQKATVQTILTNAKPTLQADMQTLKSDHQKLQSDIAAGADKSVIGQDTLTQHADAQKLRNDAQAARDQVLAKLTPDQKTSVQGCLSARGAGGWHGSTSSE